MNIKKDLFLQIGAHLMEQLKGLPNLPDLAWFDKQMGQFNHQEQFYAIPLPCILMEYQQFTWATAGNNQQRGNGSIRFYIYFENYADSFTGSVNQDTALRFFEFTDAVNIALQGLKLPGMSALEMTGDNEDSSQDMIICSTIDYSTVITNTNTDANRLLEIGTSDVTVNYKKTSSRPIKNTDTGFLVND